MDVVLYLLGALGLGAMLTSAYVFTVAARNYVSESGTRGRRQGRPDKLVDRSPVDRRGGQPVTFPLTVNGILITHDRRRLPDRRAAA